MLPLQKLLLLIIVGCNSVILTGGQEECTSFNCGSLLNISYPFWSSNSTAATPNRRNCGYPGFGINCSGGNPILSISDNLYLVKSINYFERTLTVVNTSVIGQACPIVSFNNNSESTNFHTTYTNRNKVLNYFINCSSYPSSVPYISCPGSSRNRSYVFQEDAVPNNFDWYRNCQGPFTILVLNTALDHISNNVTTYPSILQAGFQMEWSKHNNCIDCDGDGDRCGFDPDSSDVLCYCSDNSWHRGFRCNLPGSNGTTSTPEVNINGGNITLVTKVAIGVLIGVGSLVLVLLFVYRRNISLRCNRIYKWINKPRKSTNVEVFLENYGLLAVHRFTYADLKRFTNSFKDKLGQGGYGSVFKGKLHDGHLVAVKVLTESKGGGEEFINEVNTIGRTNHVNVVSLIGFCSEGSKQALVYEYMPNGSLEKFIYNKKNTSDVHPLGAEKLYQIALGIANGLEYLHRGCNTRILHFDIKPHNILLDKDFCPKISDFGMAKLCPARETSIVSMSNVRGTIGYIAPEICSSNFGGVSPKSDVYSYGMMVLEMIGVRKNVDTTVENTSETYFPQWIYNHLEQHGSIQLGEIKEMFEKETVKKMVIVGLWCIQTHPTNRPSMSMVVEMLQKSVEDLKMPPSPFEDPLASISSLSTSLHDPLGSTSMHSTSLQYPVTSISE